MKNKLISIFLILILLAVIVFIGYDLFFSSQPNENPFAYDIENLKEIDASQIGYEEVQQINIPLESVCGLAVDENDNILISGENTILIFDSKGNKIAEHHPDFHSHCLAVYDSMIYLGVGDHIEVINQKTNDITQWAVPGDSVYITSVAVKENLIFVADAGNRIAYSFDHSGNLQDTIGGKGENRPKGFIVPSPYFDIAINKNEEVWIVNPGLHTLENYSDDGRLVSSWKKSSMQLDGFSGCCNPSHIAFLHDGSFVSSEKGLIRIKIHDPTGEFKTVVAKPDQFDNKTVGLDLAVDSKERILVLDTKRLEVRIFEKKNI